MPSVQVSETHSRLVPLPQVCVKTGTPTVDVLTIKGTAAPGWSWFMIVFGFLPWLFASVASSKPYEIRVPMQSAVWGRHRTIRRYALLLFATGLVLAVVATVQGRDNSAILLFPSFLALVGYAVNEWVNTVGVHLTKDGGLRLSRVHPRFAQAVIDSRRAAASDRQVPVP